MTEETPLQNVDKLSLDNTELVLVGTAHISKKSAELVSEVIKREQPDVVAIELDQGRFESLEDPDRWKKTDLFQIVKEGKSYLLLAQLALAGFQRRLANRLDIEPGAEMRVAIEAAKETGAEIELIDRDVRITMKRAWALASWTGIFKIIGSVISSLFSREELSEEEIEQLKESDALTAMMSEFSSVLPSVKTSLIDERDSYMCEKLKAISAKKTVAIVGAGHVPGMLKKFPQSASIEELEKIPPPSRIFKIIQWGLPTLAIGLLLFGFFATDASTAKEMVTAWIVINGGLSALGALLALAHPLTILAAFLAAPFTSLNPFFAAGWVSGLVESLVRKPTVADLEDIGEDVTSYSGFLKNRVTKVLLVTAFSNLGSSLGTFIGIGKIASLLS